MVLLSVVLGVVRKVSMERGVLDAAERGVSSFSSSSFFPDDDCYK